MRSYGVALRLANKRNNDEETTPMRGRTTGRYSDGASDQSLRGDVMKYGINLRGDRTHVIMTKRQTLKKRGFDNTCIMSSKRETRLLHMILIEPWIWWGKCGD